MITEDQIERQIARIVKFASKSDMSLKMAALCAAPVVGTYDGTSAVIAHETGRSVSTVENWADAGKLYVELRKNGNKQLVRQLFRSLPASHWWLARQIQKAGYDSLHYLEKAHNHKWSGRDMIKNYETDITAGTAPMQMERAVYTLRQLAWEIFKSGGVNDKQKDALTNVLEAF